MSFKLGNTNIGELYVGSNKIGSAYLGSTKIYEVSSPTPPGPSFDEVTIGTQTWMSKNLSINDAGGGITIVDNVTANGVNMGTQYFYTWGAAVRVANSIDGWHLPTGAEWDTLATNVGGSSIAGTKLKSTSGWSDGQNGTDNYGFTVLPVGRIWFGSPSNSGSLAYFWTADEETSTKAYYRQFSTGGSITGSSSVNKNNYMFAIRLIKDT